MEHFVYLNKKAENRNPLVYYISRAGVGCKVNRYFAIERDCLYPYNIVHFVVKGSGTVIYKNKKYAVAEGQVFLLNAFDPHGYTTDPQNLMELDWLEFAGGDSIRLMKYIIENGSPVISSDFCNIRTRITRICSLLNKNPEKNRLLISGMIYSILLSLLSQCSRNSSAGGSDRYESIRKAAEYIDNNLNRDLDIKNIARIANFTPTYFAKLFHKVMGVTPARYIAEKRISKAREYICNSDMPIEQIADILGYYDTSHFIRKFRNSEGLTPSEYRRQSMLLQGRDISL